MLTKHNSPFAVYVSWKGREHLHTLVEECKTLDEAYAKQNEYVGEDCNTYIVDAEGNIIDKF